MSESDIGPDSRIEDLLAAWYLRTGDGEDVDIDDLCARDPGLAARLRSLVGIERAVTAPLTAVVPRTAGAMCISGYRIVEVLGRGGMATVYLAIDEALGRPVALKVMHPELAGDPATRQRFRREAEITAVLEHRGIVPILAVTEHAGCPVIVMKHVRGPSLAALQKPVPPRAAAVLAARIARSLHVAHLAGVIHRDVKPSNVLLEDGVPVLIDFGLARNAFAATITQEGSAPGTLLYMSPEQLQGKQEWLDPRTDIYSLGATLYELLTGRAPFAANDPDSLVRRILFQDPPPPGLPARHKDLVILVLRAMEKERDHRFASALEFAEELERYAADEPILTRPSRLYHRLWKLARRHREASAVAAAFLVALVGLAGYLIAQQSGERRILARELRRVDAMLDEEPDTGRARDLIESLARRSGGDARIDELLARCNGEDALQSLLDVVLEMGDGSFVYEDEQLRERLARLLPLDANHLRRPLADYAVALARFQLGEHELVRDDLAGIAERFADDRVQAAMRALVDGAEVEPILRESPPPLGSPQSRADQHVLAALALRIQGASLPAQEREIASALAAAPGHYRAHESQALLERRRGNHERALGLFLGLWSGGGMRPATLLHQAFEALTVGEIELANRCLEAVPEADRGPRAAIMKVQILRHSGDLVRVVEETAVALRRWPDHAELMAEQGYALLGLGRSAEAVERLQRAASATGARVVARERCRAALLAIELDELFRSSASGVSESVIAQWQERVAALLAATSDSLTRSDALLLRARLGLARHADAAHERAAWVDLRAAIAEDPHNPAARSLFAIEVARRANQPTRGSDASNDPATVTPHDIRQAFAHAAALLAPGVGSQERPIPPQCRQEAAFAQFLLAAAEQDVAMTQRCYEQLPATAPLYWETQRAHIERLRDLVEAAEGPDQVRE